MPLFSKSEKQGLWPLCSKNPDEEDCIDIFAIHGLGGDKLKTWTANGRLWLRDLLPKELPEARVLTYGYDSTVAFSKSSAEVDDYARDFLHRANSARKTRAEQKRPMIFICHSLGGILFKQALVICNNDSHYRHLLDRFHGVVFMGTPHGGSEIAFWASYAGNLLNAISLGTRTNKDILRVLRKDSAFLGSLSQKFIRQSKFMHILSFYETEKFPMLNCRIVEKESTHLNVSNEIFLPIKGDHRSMCHFSDATSQKYISVSSAIVHMVRTKPEITTGFEPPLLRYRADLNKWLDPLPMVDDYDRKRGLRLEHTCEWINQELKFLSWRDNTRTNVELWIRGPPGCGKSILATSIIDQLGIDRPTGYFFCNIEDPDRSNFTKILCTLTWQFLLKKPQLADYVYNIYLETAGATTPVESYKRALSSLLKDGEPCYVVIDGLDECRGSHTDIQKALYHISRHAKLLVTSRWETWIEQCFPLGPMTPKIDISTIQTSHDLKRLVDQRSQELDLEPELSVKLAKLLLAKAKGMFLWVQLTIDYLSQQPTLEDTVAALEDLPDGLESVYERLVRQLQMLPPSRYALARRLLQWTFSSLRPLSLEELKIALTLSPGDNRLKSPNNILNLEKFVQESCSPLLELDKVKGTVRFVHASAVDFFSRETAKNPSFMQPDEPILVAKLSNAYCAGVCLTYLASKKADFVKGDHDPELYTENLNNYLKQHPFMSYCVLNWWKHLPKPAIESDKTQDALEKSIQLFSSNQHSIVRWIQLFQLLDGLHEEEGPQATLFRSSQSPYASKFAYKGSYFHHLWAAPSGLFTRWQRWRTEMFFNGRFSLAIGIASFFDFLEVVKSECEKAKLIDFPDAIDLTPAMLAAHGESPEVLQYLFDNGANAKLTSAFGYGLARYAARNCPAILRMVLDAGAATSIPTFDDGGTPLHAASASAGFHPTILPELLKHTSDSDLDAKDFSGRTALHYAAGINIQSYARLVSDRIISTAGAIPKHRRLHTSSQEEAFMPSTRAEVETWLQSWTAHFAGESDLSESDSDEFDMESAGSTTPISNEADSTILTSNEKVIVRLVRKIKATMIVWLIGSGASISQKDSRGKKSLDIVLETGFAESLDVIDTHGLRKVSQALIALGAKQTDSYQLSALDIALMRGHLITVRGIIHEDAAISEISKPDHRFLSSFVNQDSHPRKDLSSTNEPQTPLAALHTAFILRCCLKKYSRSSGYDEPIHNKISTLIVDFAEYWVETSDTVRAWDEEHYRRRPYQVWGAKVGAYVPLADGELRKIEICVTDSGSKASGFRRKHSVYSDISFRIRNADEFEEVAPKLPSASILEVIRHPTELVEAFLLKSRKVTGEQEETIKIPSGGFQCHDYGGSWEQVWYLPSSIRKGVSVRDEEIRKWLMSLSARDTIILRPTQDFFAHDVALYGGFGLKTYSAWI